jgi:hypothetical protein
MPAGPRGPSRWQHFPTDRHWNKGIVGGHCAGAHPFPFRTGQLRPAAPMVLRSTRESRSPPLYQYGGPQKGGPFFVPKPRQRTGPAKKNAPADLDRPRTRQTTDWDGLGAQNQPATGIMQPGQHATGTSRLGRIILCIRRRPQFWHSPLSADPLGKCWRLWPNPSLPILLSLWLKRDRGKGSWRNTSPRVPKYARNVASRCRNIRPRPTKTF